MHRLILIVLLLTPLPARAQDIADFFDNHRLVGGRVLPFIRQLDSDHAEQRREAAKVLLGLDRHLDRLSDRASALLQKYADANDDRDLRADLQALVQGIRKRTCGDEVRRLLGHTYTISSVTFSPDSTRLATSSWDRTVRVWEVETGKELHCFRHDDYVQSVRFSPDGKLLASTGKEVRLFDLTTGQERFHWCEKSWSSGAYYDVCFTGDSKRLLACPNDGVMRAWDVATGKQVQKWTVGRACPLRVSPDDKSVYVGASDRVCCWSLTTGAQVWSYSSNHPFGGYSVFRSLALSHDGSALVAGNNDGETVVFEAKTGKVLRKLAPKDHPARFAALVGDRLLLGGMQDPLQLLTFPDLKPVRRLRLPEGFGSVECLALSPDGRWAAVGSHDEIIRIYAIKRP